jgi:hypothetical protein
VSNTGEVEVLLAYSHTSSMIEADVPVAWIVVPVEAVAATVVGAPVDELDKSTFVYVAIYFPIQKLALRLRLGLYRKSHLRLQRLSLQLRLCHRVEL